MGHSANSQWIPIGVRKRTTPDGQKHAALTKLTRAVVKQRGWVDEAIVNEFLGAGFNRAHLLDVVTITALKTISNYTNHLAHTPLDDAFAGQKWTRPN